MNNEYEKFRYENEYENDDEDEDEKRCSEFPSTAFRLVYDNRRFYCLREDASSFSLSFPLKAKTQMRKADRAKRVMPSNGR